MSLLIAEGFEHVRSATDVLRRFPEANSGVASTLPNQVGMLPSGRALRIENATSVFRSSALAPMSTTIRMGVGIRVHNCANAWKQISILNDSNQEQLSIQTICPGTHVNFRLMRGGTQLYLSSDLPMDVFHYLELEALIDPVFGSWLVRINEMTQAQSSINTNTSDSGTGGYSKILFNLSTLAGSGNYIELDNLYVNDTGLLGVIAIEAIAPIDDGAMSTLTVSPPGDHFAAVDDAISGGVDDDTSYVQMTSSQTVSIAPLITGLDLYKMEPLQDVFSSILNVRVSVDVNNSETSVGGPVIRSLIPGSNDLKVLGSIPVPASSGYIRGKIDLAPISRAEINETEFGMGDSEGSYTLPDGNTVPPFIPFPGHNGDGIDGGQNIASDGQDGTVNATAGVHGTVDALDQNGV